MILDEKRLFDECLKARKNSYSPYSKFAVGAVAVLKDGNFIHGTNVENAAYPSGMCAERIALFSAYAQGYRADDIVAMAVLGDTKAPISPCSGCRQVMVELLNENCPVLLACNKDEVVESTVKELMPLAFTEKDL